MATSMEEIIDEHIGRKVGFQRVDVDNNSLKAIWFHFFVELSFNTKQCMLINLFSSMW